MILFTILLFIALLIGNYYKITLIFEDKFHIITSLNVISPIIICYSLYLQNFSMIFIGIIFITLAVILIVIYIDKEFLLLKSIMFLSVGILFLIVICIVACLGYNSALFFSKIPLTDFLFGVTWQPNPEIINEKLAGSFGILPLLSGTLLIVIVAITIAVPLGLLSAIYISEYANKRIRYTINTILEILAGIPTVVYGYFAVVFLSPSIRSLAKYYNLNAQSENALVAGLVIGIMILPLITSLMENAIRSVPKTIKYGSMALGATRADTIWNIIIPYALPNIISAIILSISRIIGETMIVLMAAGITAHLTFNPLQTVTTITVQIATILTGDQNFNSIQTSSAYALGLTLFIITWFLNILALHITKKTVKPIKVN
ncbi:phosphate ABC transporter permease subunit PstC [Ehrlichia ruminantium]|uniref:phosphate ABC transporter permease subunit PstC n=1 Tax=Ehrlichia ruminantium TaxID=779 RepID=UPI0007A016AF|nr:phosphate ABC transporter permease subunit PstC [Ehrlichia ruminantium]KYW99543.1 phosphate ABC transporter permease subunit PstC [Ehrlichia ruminantium]QLK50225.1 phosphate ABC transporter permease subunit PstC [Ehrlichia ruminantium]QLK51150.1 phosphate ABC transporter permease subunit PstC [Ehrlichia ruminantium]QLK52984.1 phosphate ABC transporter permease subunit PstC [Ehrlichia ruminantium]QLK57567.1 phosphate ABC transporter permease subunit PstC [Ehrlichia ruminantium]